MSAAKERALEKHRYINVEHDDWYESVYEDFRCVMEDKHIHVERMYFTGFCSQGDGACFEGSIADGRVVQYLDMHHPNEYPMIRKLVENGGYFNISVCQHGHYCHQYSTMFSVEHDSFYNILETPTDLQSMVAATYDNMLDAEASAFEEVTKDKWRGYMGDLYEQLSDEYDALTEDDAVWDTIIANDLLEGEEDDEDGSSEDTSEDDTEYEAILNGERCGNGV